MSGPRKNRRRRDFWTPARDARLIELWHGGMGAEAIGVEIDCNKDRVWTRAAELHLPARKKTTRMRVAPERLKTRICLGGCSKPFKSEGAHHRVCNDCKNSKTWRAGANPFNNELSAGAA